MKPQSFSWPAGRRAAVSLSWDDGRVSQADRGVPILDEFGLRGTFYVVPGLAETRQALWQEAMARGHEIGNHTLDHPSGGNFPWQKPEFMLEDYTLDRIEREILEASARLEQLLGKRPATFAYCCGQSFVGRGEGVQSFVPVVARHFLIGRTYFLPTFNRPAYCDRAQISGFGIDNLSFEQVRAHIDAAVSEGGWAVLVGHDVGNAGERLNTSTEVLRQVCAYLQSRPEVWADTVETIGRYLIKHQAGNAAGMAGSDPDLRPPIPDTAK